MEDDEGMGLRGPGGTAPARMSRDRGREPSLPLFVSVDARAHSEAAEGAHGVRVDHEDVLASGVTADAIGRFGADAPGSQQALAKLGCREGEEAFEAAGSEAGGSEGKELASFLAELTTGPDEVFQPAGVGRRYNDGVERARCAEPFDRPFGVGPGGVLDEDGPGADFERMGFRVPMPPFVSVHRFERFEETNDGQVHTGATVSLGRVGVWPVRSVRQVR